MHHISLSAISLFQCVRARKRARARVRERATDRDRDSDRDRDARTLGTCWALACPAVPSTLSRPFSSSPPLPLTLDSRLPTNPTPFGDHLYVFMLSGFSRSIGFPCWLVTATSEVVCFCFWVFQTIWGCCASESGGASSSADLFLMCRWCCMFHSFWRRCSLSRSLMDPHRN